MSPSPVSTATPLVTRRCAGHITTKPCARSRTCALHPTAEHVRGAAPLRLRPRGAAPARGSGVEPGTRPVTAWSRATESAPAPGATRAPGDGSSGPGGARTSAATRGAVSALPTTRAAREGSCTCSLAPARPLVGISVSGARYHSSVRHANEPPWGGTYVPRAPRPGNESEGSYAVSACARGKSIPPAPGLVCRPARVGSRERPFSKRARSRVSDGGLATRGSRDGFRDAERGDLERGPRARGSPSSSLFPRTQISDWNPHVRLRSSKIPGCRHFRPKCRFGFPETW